MKIGPGALGTAQNGSESAKHKKKTDTLNTVENESGGVK
jgi:hypothetical protein